MKFAVVNGQRQEAQPDLSGTCPTCESAVVARCGEVNIWHWAHRGRLGCDIWWENETEWHRAWKGRFPVDWQEVVHRAENGEKHIADVRTGPGRVIEFQHSYLDPDERRSRNNFYPKLIWVVDATRRKRDSNQLLRAWNDGRQLSPTLALRRAPSDDCNLLREWVGSNGPVFFDVGEQQPLWWLFAANANGSAYLGPYPREAFVESLRDDGTAQARQFEDLVTGIPRLITDYESYLRAQPTLRYPIQAFHQSVTRKSRASRRP